MKPEDNDAIDYLDIDKKVPMTSCSFTIRPHNYIPVAWVSSPTSKHVTTILCTICFKLVNMDDIYKLR